MYTYMFLWALKPNWYDLFLLFSQADINQNSIGDACETGEDLDG